MTFKRENRVLKKASICNKISSMYRIFLVYFHRLNSTLVNWKTHSAFPTHNPLAPYRIQKVKSLMDKASRIPRYVVIFVITWWTPTLSMIAIEHRLTDRADAVCRILYIWIAGRRIWPLATGKRTKLRVNHFHRVFSEDKSD